MTPFEHKCFEAFAKEKKEAFRDQRMPRRIIIYEFHKNQITNDIIHVSLKYFPYLKTYPHPF